MRDILPVERVFQAAEDSGCLAVFVDVLFARSKAIFAGFGAFDAVEVFMFPALLTAVPAGLDAHGQNVLGEISFVREGGGREVANICAFDRKFEASPHHIYFFLFQTGVEAILAFRLAFVHKIQKR